jgi:hypothetical protein
VNQSFSNHDLPKIEQIDSDSDDSNNHHKAVKKEEMKSDQ